VQLIDSAVNYNSATVNGGGIVVESATLKLENSIEIKGNVVGDERIPTARGGGIMLSNQGSIILFVGQENPTSTFDISDNRAYSSSVSYGGGIYSNGAFIFLGSPGKYPENNYAFVGTQIFVNNAGELIHLCSCSCACC